MGHVLNCQLLLQMLSTQLKIYISDPWNKCDQVMYILLIVAVILRFTLTNESDFVYARYVYAVDLVIFYLRILQLYYCHKRLGPKVILIGRMVCVIIDQDEMQDTLSTRLAFSWKIKCATIYVHHVSEKQFSKLLT